MWAGYESRIENQLDRAGIRCTGAFGVNSACRVAGILFVVSGVGTLGGGHQAHLDSTLSAATDRWRVCAWHKNERLMQVGGKQDEVGWAVYEKCRQYGAIVATGHEHSYSRTHTMTDFENQLFEASEVVSVGPGRSFAFVSGLGGRSIRLQYDDLAANPWWASVYSATQGADYGTLFCAFGGPTAPDQADCYFRDISGNTPDRFTVINEN